MKSKVNELRLDAGIARIENQQWLCVLDKETGMLIDPMIGLEKFAELIVQECGNWFNSRLVVEPDYGIEHRIERNRAVVGVMKEFNQHFGVEE